MKDYEKALYERDVKQERFLEWLLFWSVVGVLALAFWDGFIR